MNYRRILTVQDISCVGQCSITVALPILSACGHETCILPSAVLSTHTGGFGMPHIKDLKFEKGSIPIETTYWGVLQDPYGSVLLFYPDQNKRLIRAFTEGEVKP